MNAKDLMIGDWVYLCTPKEMIPCQVTALDETTIWQEYYKEICESKNYKPIPLTEEILEKNGFKFDGTADWLLERRKDNLFIKVCPVQPDNSLWWDPSMTGFEINNSIADMLLEGVEQIYVHQFQQVLRLCKVDLEIKL